MRATTDIKVKRKRVGIKYCDVNLPKEGEIISLEDKTFKVYNAKLAKNGLIHEAEFILGTMDGELTLSLKISSLKPFRTEK